MVWKRESEYAGFSTVPPWLPVKEAQQQLSVDQQVSSANSILSWYCRLLGLRRQCGDLKTSGTRFIDLAPDVLAFERGEVTAIFNLTSDRCRISGVPLEESLIDWGVTFDDGDMILERYGLIVGIRLDDGL